MPKKMTARASFEAMCQREGITGQQYKDEIWKFYELGHAAGYQKGYAPFAKLNRSFRVAIYHIQKVVLSKGDPADLDNAEKFAKMMEVKHR